MKIDEAEYEKHTAPARPVLFEYFEDMNVVRELQVYLWLKGWKVVEVENERPS